MYHRKIYKFLIIWVFANIRGTHSHRLDMCIFIKLRHHSFHGDVLTQSALGDVRVCQHTAEFFSHAQRGYPMDTAFFQRIQQRSGSRVLVNPQIQQDIGVKYHLGGIGIVWLHGIWVSILSLQGHDRQSQQTLIHGQTQAFQIASIPLVIQSETFGTLRDSFKRMRPGNFKSGVNTQARQPA